MNNIATQEQFELFRNQILSNLQKMKEKNLQEIREKKIKRVLKWDKLI